MLKLSLSMLFSLVAYSDVIKIGYIEFSPLIFSTKEGEIRGPIPRYAKMVFSNKELRWKHIPLKRVSRSLNEGQIDVFVSLFKTTERENKVSYHTTPYYELKPSVCGLTEKMPKKVIETFKIFKGKSLVFVRGTLKDEKFPASANFIEINVRNYQSRSIKMLKSKRVDFAYYGDSQTMANYIKKSSIKGVRCYDLPIKPLPIYMVTRLKNPLINEIEKRILKYGKMK